MSSASVSENKTNATAVTPAAAASASAATSESSKDKLPTVAVFDKDVPHLILADYDAGARRNIIGYEDVHSLAGIMVGASTASKLLVVGCGTGQECVSLSGFPRAKAGDRWSIVSCDPSERMCELARARWQLHTKQAGAGAAPSDKLSMEILTAYTSTLPSTEAYQQFDGATSILVMHFCPDDESAMGKMAYLKAIAQRLKDGAKLFIVDGCGDRKSTEFDAIVQQWVKFQVARGATAAMVEMMVKGMLGDKPMVHPVPVSRLLQLLAANGFQDIVPVYQSFILHGFVATYKAPTVTAAGTTKA
jgi:tRNA (cmo5U34)-methyltransferase